MLHSHMSNYQHSTSIYKRTSSIAGGHYSTVVSSLFIIVRQMTMVVRAIMIDQNDTSKSRFVAIIRCAF